MGAMTARISRSVRSKPLTRYLWLGLLGQLVWGSYPPTAKRALMEVPKFSLLLLATTASTGVGVWLMWREERRSFGEVVRFLFRERVLWALAFFVVLRSVTNLLAIDLTHATWVQLMYLMTPFAVAILGTLFFGEPTPPYTYQALALSTLGAALTLIEDWRDIWAGFTPQDVLGLAVAGLSMLALATYFQLVRRSSRREAGRGLIMVQQGLAMSLTYLLLGLLSGESWAPWLHLTRTGWVSVLWVLGGVFMLGNLLQVTALSGANAALITSLMPLRLISAIALGWLLLDERLRTALQWLGAALVLVTVSGYLWLQARGSSEL